MVSRKTFLHLIIIVITSFIAVITTLTTSNPTFHVIALWSIVIVAIFICKFDLLHPYFWFSGFFALYASSYTIILMLGFQTNTGYSYENTLLSIIALTTALLIIGPKKNKLERNDLSESSSSITHNLNINRRIIRNMLIVLFILLIIAVIIVSQLGVQMKSDLVSNRYLSFLLATYIVRYISLYCCLYIVLSGKNVKVGPIIICCGIAVLLFTLFTAERDGIFRFLLIIIIAMFATRRIDRKTLPIIIGIGMVAVVLLSYLKYYFISGVVRADFIDRGILYNFLNSDFAAAGENMQVLLNNPWTKSYLDYKFILTDLLAPFYVGDSVFNIGTWYNDIFYYGKSSRAFTLLGEGYVVDGYVGVIVLFFIVGMLIAFMYQKSNKNAYWLTAYIYTIVTVASSFRGTLGSISGTLFRIVFIGIAGFVVYKSLFLARRRTKQVSLTVRDIT